MQPVTRKPRRIESGKNHHAQLYFANLLKRKVKYATREVGVWVGNSLRVGPLTVTRNCVAKPDAALIPCRLHRHRTATLICEFLCRAFFPFRSLSHFMWAFDRYFSPVKALHGRLLGFPTSEKMLVGRFPKASSKTWLGFATSSGLAGCVATRSSALVSESTSTGANSRPPKRR